MMILLSLLPLPRQEAAISIIRLSGKGVIEFTNQIFSSDLSNKKSHTITYGYIMDDEKRLDEVLVQYLSCATYVYR